MQMLFIYGRPAALDPRGGELRARGGITAALIALTRRLAQRGHDIHVFARCSHPGEFERVLFHDRSELAAFSASRQTDALVVIPDLLSVLMPIRARARMVWTGNAFAHGDCALTASWPWAPDLGPPGRTARLYPIGLFEPLIDRVVVKSHWQAAYVSAHHGLPPGKLTVIHNGVPLGLFDGPGPTRHPHRIVYTSHPRRGLNVLLRLFPHIRNAVPDAELHVFGNDPDSDRFVGATQPGVVLRGRVSQRDLADELRAASVMAYPCTFKETFCTCVAEAQAAGLPVVTTDRAALVERVHDEVNGTIVGGSPADVAFDRAFADAVVRQLRDDGLRRRQSEAAMATAREHYDWDTITSIWEETVRELIARNHDPFPVGDIDFLDPALLKIADRGRTALVPASLARSWLVDAWTAYGFDIGTLSGSRLFP